MTGTLNTSSGRDRLEGFRRAVGSSFRTSLVAEGDWSLRSGRLGADRILEQHPDIDAIFVASDLMAVGAMDALHRAGRRIPDDVAVAGFDDSAAATMAEPQLTTMHNPFEETALEALRILDELMEGHSGGCQHAVLPTSLVRRGSA